MKSIYSILCLCVLMFSCQQMPDNSANEAYEKNSKTIETFLEEFQNESVDYSIFAEDFVALGTSFGAKDSLSLDEIMESDKSLWETYDLELKNLVMLPGVNADTKLADGSVRYYGDWKATLAATDSTEEKSGVVKWYASFDFNEEGKIIYGQGYGDVTGIIMYLNSTDSPE